MGGVGKGRGNITPVSEFNIWVDPEAAKMVFDSGMKMKMVGWDISRNHACIDPELCAEIKAIGTPLAEFSMDIQNTVKHFSTDVTKLPGFDLPDPIAMAIAIDEEGGHGNGSCIRGSNYSRWPYSRANRGGSCQRNEKST